MHLWESPEDGLAVVAACTGHPTLRELSFWGNNIPATASAAVGVALAALVDADSALESLNVSDCSLDDAALHFFFAAVASSTLLRKLDCSDNHISAECAESVILPAVQANTSLRELEFYLDTDNGIIPELEQAVELVQARS
jgi:Ran GTPase-activating protein (RanGAP) involved in mRNA processing and transport